jgi:hypothetical protein
MVKTLTLAVSLLALPFVMTSGAFSQTKYSQQQVRHVIDLHFAQLHKLAMANADMAKLNSQLIVMAEKEAEIWNQLSEEAQNSARTYADLKIRASKRVRNYILSKFPQEGAAVKALNAERAEARPGGPCQIVAVAELQSCGPLKLALLSGHPLAVQH